MSTDNTPMLNAVSLSQGCISRGSQNRSSPVGSNVLCLNLQMTIYNRKVVFIYLLLFNATKAQALKRQITGQVNKHWNGCGSGSVLF
jgi:hypothetical protein